ncbi:MAG: Abi family protein, partial [Clostridia bacterium]|nr:Abi family protein [Clostridia bacterium]
MEPNRVLLTPESLVRHLKEEGVRFTLMDESQAIHYLSRSTNFFKINTYKKNYAARRIDGKSLRQFESLEFAYLRELDHLDRSLRRVCSTMCLDVEHCIKVRLLQLAQETVGEDGY